MTMTRQVPVLDIIITRDVQGPETGRDSFNRPTYGPTTTHKVWAARRDSPAGDDIKPTAVVQHAAYIVRVGTAWKAGDRFTDEDGNRRQVDGVARLGRGHLELLAKRVG